MKSGKGIWLLLFMLPLSSWALSAACSSADGLRHAWEREIRWRISQGLVYVYGGNIFETGIDCSAFPYLTLRDAGAKNLQRLTADDIYHGKDGWKGYTVAIRDADSLDLVFWVWSKKKDRPLELVDSLKLPQNLTYEKRQKTRIDHMGIVLVGKKSGLLEVAHMSSSRGGVIEEFKGTLARDCVGARRLNLEAIR